MQTKAARESFNSTFLSTRISVSVAPRLKASETVCPWMLRQGTSLVRISLSLKVAIWHNTYQAPSCFSYHLRYAACLKVQRHQFRHSSVILHFSLNMGVLDKIKQLDLVTHKWAWSVRTKSCKSLPRNQSKSTSACMQHLMLQETPSRRIQYSSRTLS